MRILIIEPPAVSKFGNQRIFGAMGAIRVISANRLWDLMMISGYLRKEGFDNVLIDANASRKTIDDIREIIKKNLQILFSFLHLRAQFIKIYW